MKGGEAVEETTGNTRWSAGRRRIKIIGLPVAIVMVVATGTVGVTTAGASTTGLTRLAPSLMVRPGITHVAIGPEAPRIPGLPNISKVTTASTAFPDITPQVSTTTMGISATYIGTTLVVHWNPGRTLTVSGAGPLSAGSSLVEGLGAPLGGTMSLSGSNACNAPHGLGVVSIG